MCRYVLVYLLLSSLSHLLFSLDYRVLSHAFWTVDVHLRWTIILTPQPYTLGNSQGKKLQK